MIEFISTCGFAGIVSLALTLLVGTASVLFAILSRSRKLLLILAFLALLPLGVGLLGTAAGYSQVASTTAVAADLASQALIQHGRERARYTTYLGLGCTIFLFMIIGVSSVMKRNAEPSVPGDA